MDGPIGKNGTAKKVDTERSSNENLDRSHLIWTVHLGTDSNKAKLDNNVNSVVRICVILISVGCRKIKDLVSLSMVNNKSEIFVNLNIIQCNYKILGTKVCALTYKIIKQSDSFLHKDFRDSLNRPKVG